MRSTTWLWFSSNNTTFYSCSTQQHIPQLPDTTLSTVPLSYLCSPLIGTPSRMTNLSCLFMLVTIRKHTVTNSILSASYAQKIRPSRYHRNTLTLSQCRAASTSTHNVTNFYCSLSNTRSFLSLLSTLTYQQRLPHRR